MERPASTVKKGFLKIIIVWNVKGDSPYDKPVLPISYGL